MKIAVVGCDGDTEIITLNGPVEIHEGDVMGYLHSAEGYDHYFYTGKERLGRYDGWGLGAPDQGWTQEQAMTYLRATQSERETISLTFRRFLYFKFRKLRKWVVWWKGYLLQEPGYPRWGERGL